MAKSLVIADLPTLKEKNIRRLNTGSIRAKRQSSYSQKDIKCYHGLILVPNLSRCVGKWLIYIQIHAPHFRHALDRAQNDPHVPGATGTLRPSGWQGEDRFLQDAERSRHGGQRRATTREGRRLSTPLPEPKGLPRPSQRTQSGRAKFSFPVSLASSAEGRCDPSQSAPGSQRPAQQRPRRAHVPSLARRRRAGTPACRRDAAPRAGSGKANAAPGRSGQCSPCLTKPRGSAQQLELFGNLYLGRNLGSHSAAPGHGRASGEGLKTVA